MHGSIDPLLILLVVLILLIPLICQALILPCAMEIPIVMEIKRFSITMGPAMCISMAHGKMQGDTELLCNAVVFDSLPSK